MPKVNNKFEQTVVRKAKDIISKSLSMYKNELFVYLEQRFFLMAEDFTSLRTFVKKYSHRTGLKVLKVDKNIPDLGYKKEGDSGLDVVSTIDLEIKPKDRVIVPTGIRASVKKGYEIQVRPKSSLRQHLVILGTVDSNYRDEIGVDIFNPSSTESVFIKKYERVGQLVVAPVVDAVIKYVDDEKELGKSTRTGGFGSTNHIHWVTIKELNLEKDVLLNIKDTVEELNEDLPLIMEGFLTITNIKLNLNRISAKIELSQDVSFDIESNLISKDGKNYKLTMSSDKENGEFLYALIEVESNEDK